ncbi:MAG TPA: ribose-phosphate pyrophosphokinase [Rhabdochlamydiaceae bacterium]|nr:ribose-phosphate pyrophosphokinase [Rhabdochlamydiaceae bacterium]
MQPENSFMLFAGTSHPELSQQIADFMGVQLGKVLIETFPDGEIGVQVLESVRGKDVFVLQSVARHPNFYLMELLILVDALKRASARSIVAVIPYFGYARQDRRGKGREPITAKLVADLLEKAGVTRVLTMDLHAEQIQGFFDIPVDNLYARPLLVEAVREWKLDKPVVVAPDLGSIKLARAFSESLKVDLAIVDKRRVNAKKVEMNALIGEVDERDVLLIDDMCSTGGTLKTAAMVCKHAGAKRICAAVTHGLLIGSAFEESAIEKILISNTVPLTDEIDYSRVQIVSVASLFAKAIDSIVGAKSISSLFSRP